MGNLPNNLTIDIDTGGTFTDGTISDGKTAMALKVLTTPHDLTICFNNLIKSVAGHYEVNETELLKKVQSIRYSTTVGTNTIIERKGPRIGLVVRESDLSLFHSLDENSLLGCILAPAETTVRGISVKGTGADKESILKAVEDLLNEGAERLVISISGESEELERLLKLIIFKEYPRHILGALPVLFSTELTDDSDIFRRTATAVLNAYLHPGLEHFLYKAEDILRNYRYPKPLFVFCNDGTSNRVAKVTALKTYNSGPIGGLEGALYLARHYGFENVATIDIGGTSTDVAFVHKGNPEEASTGSIEEFELSFPLRKINGLGGGGGTIARFTGKGFQLGPESAGAVPGPACFGFGGVEATLTDANVVIGYFDRNAILAGQVAIDGERAELAVKNKVAQPLGLSIEEAAILIRDTLEKRIGETLRMGILERGQAPENVVLMAFGGAGPVHACGIAAHAGISKVLIPGQCSVFSSFGISFSDVMHKYERNFSGYELDKIRHQTENMIKRAQIDMRGEGFAKENVKMLWDVNVDRNGQSLMSMVDREDIDEIFNSFEKYLNPKSLSVNITLKALANLPHVGLARNSFPAAGIEPVSRREVIWTSEKRTNTPVYSVDDIKNRIVKITGPAVVEGAYTTFVIPVNWSLASDESGQFILTAERNDLQ